MDVVDALGVLGRQGGRGRHGVAAVGGDDFLVRLETTFLGGALYQLLLQCVLGDMISESITYAPPEQSEPAMTNTRPGAISLVAVRRG